MGVLHRVPIPPEKTGLPFTGTRSTLWQSDCIGWIATFVVALGLTFGTGAGSVAAQEPSTPEEAPAPSLTERIFGPSKTRPPKVLDFIRNNPGESKPISMDADRVSFWKQNNETVLVLEGKVLIQHGFINIHCDKAVAWLNPRQHQLTGVWKMDIQTEGNLVIDASTENQKADKGHIELNTRGEIKVTSVNEKANRNPDPNSPLVVRLSGERQKRRETPEVAKKESADKKQLEVEKSGFWGPAMRTPGIEPLKKPTSPIPLEKDAKGPTSLLPGDNSLEQGDSLEPRGKIVRTSFYYQPPPAPPPPTVAPTSPPSGTAVPGPITLNQNTPPAPPAPVNPFGALPAPPPEASNPNLPTLPAPSAPPTTGPVVIPTPPSGQGLSPWNGQSINPGALTVPDSLTNPLRTYTLTPRSSTGFRIMVEPVGDNEQAILLTGGAVVQVKDLAKNALIDMEADRVVIWTKGGNPQQILGNMQSQGGATSKEIELYLSGNVEVRLKGNPKAPSTGVADPRKPEQMQNTMRANEVYYDVKNNRAVALDAELEFSLPYVPDPVIVRAAELQQLELEQYRVFRGEMFSSRTPGDPGLKVTLSEATIEDREVPRQDFLSFLIPESMRRHKPEEKITHTYIKGKDSVVRIGDIPVFWSPYFQGDAEDPLGPIEGVNLGFNRIYGGQFGVTLNAFDLLGMNAPEGTKWRWGIDYLTSRGPATGTDFNYNSQSIFGIPSKWNGMVTAYGLYDNSSMGLFNTRDILGGNRFDYTNPSQWRGRLTWRQTIEPTNLSNLSIKSQLAGLTDRNFQEQFFKREFDNDINQSTFVNIRQQEGPVGWNILAEPRVRGWVNETAQLPKANGFITGYDLFNIFTYSANGGAGYGYMMTTNDPTPQYSPTDVGVAAGRFNLFQELSAPFSAGPFRVDPYVKGDMAYYTSQIDQVANTTVNGSRGLTSNDGISRFWGGFGSRFNLPMSKLYSDMSSEMFNLDGIYHKANFGMNYFYGASNQFYQKLPQFDRFNDDSTDMAMRDWVYFASNPLASPTNPLTGTQINPANAIYNPFWFQNYSQRKYDPQNYGIRSLADNRIDTLNAIQTLQMNIDQRWQTKRGMPGAQHTVDFLSLNLGTTLFPNPNRDNFGELFGLYNYDLTWNPGDKTAIVSSGWMDSFEGGAKVANIGGFYNRDDRTNLYLGFRYYNPIDSRLLTGAVNYVFSPKYALTASSSYDFGANEALSNSLVLTRMGKDLQVSLGLSYNATTNNFGLTFQIIPILATYGNRMQMLNNGGI